MLNRTHYKRLTDKENITLATDLTYFDLKYKFVGENKQRIHYSDTQQFCLLKVKG